MRARSLCSMLAIIIRFYQILYSAIKLGEKTLKGLNKLHAESERNFHVLVTKNDYKDELV
jgi:hypothetical protein